MALVIRRRVAESVADPVQSIAPDLAELGLEEDCVPDGVFKVGKRVKIVMEPYPWTTLWEKGDTGEIVRMWPATREFEKLGEGYEVLEIRLDQPRNGGYEITYFNKRDLKLDD